MIIGRIFYFISSLVMLAACFVFLSPSLLTPDLIYPERIDSTYLVFHAKDHPDSREPLLFNPGDVGLKYSELDIITEDSLQLRGWFVKTEDSVANTILILHDLNESKILYLDHLKQFHDRGFNVCVFDLRAHGTSEGTEFSPGLPAVEDVKIMIDTLLGIKSNKHLILMGVGVSSAIALQAAVYDGRCDILVLQSPFNNFQNYLERYARRKWGIMKEFLYPVFARKEESLLRYPLKELDLTTIASFTDVPTFFITGSDDKMNYTSEVLEVSQAAATEKKELILVKNSGSENIAKAGGETYYNKITAFINAALPKEQKITRYKKLVMK